MVFRKLHEKLFVVSNQFEHWCHILSEVEVSVVAMAVGVGLVLLVSQQKVIYVIRTFNSD